MKYLEGFATFLNEGRQRGVLYHFTTPRGLTGIMADDAMDSPHSAVSFTRNYLIKGWPEAHGACVRIAFDGDTLSDHHKIEPFLYDPGKDEVAGSGNEVSIKDRREFFGDEREERISKALVKKIKRHILAIDVLSPHVMKRTMIKPDTSFFTTYLDKLQAEHPDIRVSLVDEFVPYSRHKEAVPYKAAA